MKLTATRKHESFEVVRPFALSTLLLISACADICERGASLSTSFPTRHAACYASDTLPSPVFDTAACDNSMDACSPKDETALHEYFNCLERLPVCTNANRQAFNEKVLTCANGMGRISEGCFRP